MAQKLRRATTGVRRQARARDNSRKVRTARNRGRSLTAQALSHVPLSQQQWQRLLTTLILAVAAVLAWMVASASGVVDAAAQRGREAVIGAGYQVVHVEVRGSERTSNSAIREWVWAETGDLAMTEIDLEHLRKGLRKLPWVEDARVSRQLPDVLVIDIVEHQPHAVLRHNGEAWLVNAQGERLEPATAADAAERVVIEGDGAADQVRALATLLDAAPALRAQVRSAEWIGNRRWNLMLGTGQQLSLPEGPAAARTALRRFAQADGSYRLVGGDVVSFDMRNPPMVFMRVPGRETQQRLVLEEES